MSEGEDYLIWSIGTIFQLLAIFFAILIMLRKEKTYSLVGFLIFFNILTTEFIPPFYSFIFDVYPDFIFLLRKDSISYGVLLSGCYWLIFIAALHFISANKLTVSLSGKIANQLPTKIFKPVLITLAFLSFLGAYSLDQRTLEEGFASVKGMFEGRNVRSSLLTGLLGPFGGLANASAAALIAASLMQENIKSTFWMCLRIITWFFLISTVIFGFTMGARGKLLSVAVLASIIFWLFYGKRKVIYMFIILLIVGIIISPVIMIYKSKTNLYVGVSTLERIQNIFYVYEHEARFTEAFDAIEGIIFRYDGIHNGGNLAIYSTESENPYFKPYLTSILGMIPRYFWPDKPQPKSVDGTASTTPNIMTGVVSGRPWLMTSVTPSAVAFWQFNLIGILIIPLFQAWISSALISVSDRYGRPELFLFYFLLLNPLGLLVQTWFIFLQWVLPLSIIFYFLKNFSLWRK